MRFEQNGKSLWYGERDTPIPDRVVQAGTNNIINVGLSPVDGAYIVEVLYRVNEGPTKIVGAHWVPSIASVDAQYFRAELPIFQPGDRIHYGVICHYGGRQIPAEEDLAQLPVSFQIARGNGKQPEPNMLETATLALNLENNAELMAPTAMDPPLLPEVTIDPSAFSSKESEVAEANAASQAKSVFSLKKNPSQDEVLSSSLQPVSGRHFLELPDDEKKRALPEASDVIAENTLPGDMTSQPVDPLILAGDFTIVTPNNEEVLKQDFEYYELSAEFSIQEFKRSDLQILHYEFDDDLQVEKNSTKFSFSDSQHIPLHSIVGKVWIMVISFDGTILWSKEYDARDPRLAQLNIKVPLQTPLKLRSPDKKNIQDKPKKLRGQVLPLAKKCQLKDLTVLIEAKAQGDTIWKIVGAATTDRAGNFSMPYPFGVFTEARALISATPNSPVDIKITDVKEGIEGKQSIKDDFLYLGIKDLECPDNGAKEDCDCDTPKKASRLPDQADLIESDEYTQDIGGSCINLSTPNRTLSEFNYQAIVRTSDPQVANYTLKKEAIPVQKGIDPVLFFEISRTAAVLDTVVNNLPVNIDLSESDRNLALEKVRALRTLTSDASSADVATALSNIDSLIAMFDSYLIQVVTPEPSEPPVQGNGQQRTLGAGSELGASMAGIYGGDSGVGAALGSGIFGGSSQQQQSQGSDKPKSHAERVGQELEG